jgi:signal transduction histidine kinase
VVGVAALGYGVANLPDPPIIFALALAVYSVGAVGPRRVSLPFAVGITVAGLVAFLLDRQTDAADVAVNYVVGITSWVVGDSMRVQRERAVWLADRQRAEAERAAADERVRIARDLHDIVAHHLSVVVVQTEAAQEVLAVDPARAGAAMAAVGDTARTALTELRRALGALRADSGRAPHAGLDGLDALVASVRAAGLAVDLRTDAGVRRDGTGVGAGLGDREAGDGVGGRLGDTDADTGTAAGRDGAADGDRGVHEGAGGGAASPGGWGGVPVAGVVGATAYRIVQEALTNVLRHADARRACVEVDVEGDVLVVRVSDDGRGCDPAGGPSGEGGQGLVGMRERVTALGGELAAGPGRDGGFVVRAVLPLVGRSG